MQEIGLSDTIDIEKAERTALFVNGQPDPEADKNLIIKAVRALERETGLILPVDIQLTKRIPSRAGLGGGCMPRRCTPAHSSAPGRTVQHRQQRRPPTTSRAPAHTPGRWTRCTGLHSIPDRPRRADRDNAGDGVSA